MESWPSLIPAVADVPLVDLADGAVRRIRSPVLTPMDSSQASFMAAKSSQLMYGTSKRRRP